MDEKLLDRVSQAYYGDLNDVTKYKVKRRVDWMVEQVRGNSVLDVGCSQGITSIILAKQGKRVVGIDYEYEQIEYANKDKEKHGIGDNLTFLCGDFINTKIEEKFDTVIMGEILEHLFNPILFIDKAIDLLNDSGKLIVTVPFGINPFPDHKRTYYFSELFTQLSQRMAVVDVVFFGEWIAFVADKELKETTIEINLKLIEKIENAFFVIDEKNHDFMDKMKNIKENVQSSNEILKKELSTLKSNISRLTAENGQLKKDNKQIATLKNQLSNKNNEINIIKNNAEDLNAKLYNANRLNKAYERLITVKLYNLLRKLKNRLKKKQITINKKIKHNNNIKYPVTVIIPTYKDNEYIYESINSVLEQSYPSDKLDVIISVNGEDKQYYNNLKNKYKNNDRINVIYTDKKGASVARNNAVKIAKGQYVYFLDDDDYISNGLISELVSKLDKTTDVVCGKISDLNEDNTINYSTYVNNVINKAGEGEETDYYTYTSLFVTLCGKLYKTSFLKDVCTPINENFSNTEDVIFWTENVYKISNPFYVVSPDSKETYVRRLTDNSLSRPSKEEIEKFYIDDRLKIIEHIEQFIFNESIPVLHKRFCQVLIQAQQDFMLKKFNDILADKQKEDAQTKIFNSKSSCLNKGLFSDIKGVAFCHNFSPFIDASAFVATKRLSEINKLVGETIAWDVVCSDMSNVRDRDKYFDMFFAHSKYVNKDMFGKAYWNEEAQYQWGVAVAQKYIDKNEKYKYIYSRSMWAASHIAAYYYKKANPDVYWIAEFSDPMYVTNKLEKREIILEYTDENNTFRRFWYDIEKEVCKLADKVILTNENQKKFMRMYNDDLLALDDQGFDEKCIVKSHPIMDHKWCNVIGSSYKVDKDKINIGYFGSLHSIRKIDDMLNLLENENVILHVFSPQNPEFDIERKYKSRVKVNDSVSQLECLNIGSKMDYVYLEEGDISYDMSPYIPSKLADYVTMGVKIIAKITCKDSPIEKYDYDKIIKIKKIDSELINSLSKNKL